MIKVFRVPSGKRQYLPLYRQIQESGRWQVLNVTQNLLTEEWMIRCCNKKYFLSQSIERQVQIAKGERSQNY
jgi:cell division inhibitor SulA